MTVAMGGEQTSNLRLRLSDALKGDLDTASKLGTKTAMAEIVRVSVEPYVAFSKVHGRRPHDFTELAEWHLAALTKKK